MTPARIPPGGWQPDTHLIVRSRQMTQSLPQFQSFPEVCACTKIRCAGFGCLLAPERTINLDPIGLAILQEVDGRRSFGALVELLAAKYDAPVDQITGDVAEFITGLTDRRILELT